MPNYKPSFYMPIVAPQVATTITATAPHRYPVQIHVSDAAYRQLFTMAGGPIYFVPEGTDPFFLYQMYPDIPPLLPGTGYLRQHVWMGDIKELRFALPEGVPPMVEIVYFNVDPASFRADVRPFMKFVPLSVLKSFGTIAGSPDQNAYETQLLDRILQGKAGIFFPAGAKVGQMASADFTLFFTGDDLIGLSPIPFLRSMPDFAGDRWKNHPLINAVATLTVPVDIYARFQIWSVTDSTVKVLPDGLAVRLVDHESPTTNTTLATLPLANGDGTVAFSLTDAQLKHSPRAPNLLFEIDLGNANPEPDLISDPWRSYAHEYKDNPGYFENFQGTRLGSDISPLRFTIGLRFWKDLISFRPPPTVQMALQAQGHYGQPIEEAFNAIQHDPVSQQDTEVYADISLDYYAVRITLLPPEYATPKDLMDYIRTNFDKFYDHSISVFSTEDPRWTDPNASPVGVVLGIDFKTLGISPDSGSVVVSAADTGGGFTVNTVSDKGTLLRLYHPLGGIRRWGFVNNADGSFTFFVQGADRPFHMLDWGFRELIFWGADRLWTSYQQALKKFVDDKLGKATILPGFAQRFDWILIKKLYWFDDTNNPWIRPP